MSRLILFSLISFFILGAELSYAGNAALGKSKSAVCEKCHGADGISENAAIPKLAGQQAAFFVKEIKDFKAGDRKNPLMEPIAASLGNADIDDLAAYYGGLKSGADKTDPALSSQGRDKYNLCAGCHGPEGAGQGPIPRIAGQHSAYIAAQLGAYKSGGRKNQAMNAVTMSLSEGDIKALAEYAAGLK